MSDFLLSLGQSPQARKIVRGLGLPIPLPQTLRRGRGPYEDRPLDGETVIVGGALAGPLARVIAEAIIGSGGVPLCVPEVPRTFAELGEAYARVQLPLSEPVSPP